ncbi:fumarylacetoacetase [Comamonas sp. J-3]|uniref:fumarylacetoacetase n=1 Tax=Comamonas trifloxystrobinivorans TaxID=3350256 RepID=UPI00372CB4A7
MSTHLASSAGESPASPNDAALASFVPVAADSHFPIQNLPFGIFSTEKRTRRAGVAIGDCIVDLQILAEAGLICTADAAVFRQPCLNAYISLGRATTSAVRRQLSELLRHDNPTLRDNTALRQQAIVPMAEARMHLPVAVGGFSDFMLSREHSLNCVDIVGGSSAGQLWPNWTYLPMAYNGRASSVVVGGTPVKRPWGQVVPPGESVPRYEPSQKLDFELEAAVVVGTSNALGSTIAIDQAEQHAFGVVLLNDWSTRDIQAWEAQPLGVFVSKGHRTSISPWVVTLDALEPFRIAGPEQSPPPLPYLNQQGLRNFDVHMQASIKPRQASTASVVCRSNLKHLYWSFAQQIAHHASTGCNLQTGDLLGTGTVSTSGPGGQGCLYEATRNGQQHIDLEHGGSRVYLEDGDEVTLTAWAQAPGYRIGFGACTGTVLPADALST